MPKYQMLGMKFMRAKFLTQYNLSNSMQSVVEPFRAEDDDAAKEIYQSRKKEAEKDKEYSYTWFEVQRVDSKKNIDLS